MPASVERAIAELARRQHGYVNRQQLLKLGLGAKAIDYRIATGRLITVHAGVYAVGHLPTLPLDRAHAALLACGPDAILSHGSAASVWGIESRWRMPFEVTVPRARRRPGITTHRAELSRADITDTLGVRVTSPARTLLDNARRLTVARLTRSVDDLLRPGWLRLHDLTDVVDRFPRHPGTRCLRPFVSRRRGITRSEFERLFTSFTRRFGLPEPLINELVNGREVDAFFPVERVIVELDGWEFHSSRTAFRSDRERDAEMLAADLPTVRVTYDRLTETPEREAARLHAILEARRRGLAA